MRVRDKRAYGWFEAIQQDVRLETYQTEYFVQLPNQLAINLDEESSEKHDRMVERVGQQVMSLCLLNHNPDLQTQWTARYDDLDDFADELMTDILTMLAPGLNETDSSVQHFFCNIAAYKDFTGMTAICGQMTTGDIIRRGKWNYR
ncbi:hypothetical protein EDB82DRAFT_526585 [Fusarium venenatum]|uniref:uncharacterized protein n=1 Tax=Fusarium venenatum TaxID=56646 RepID=UPI001DB34B23|nr:hypothetical protein EDB82DRAFT_526585 [Fusarium venenatum]